MVSKSLNKCIRLESNNNMLIKIELYKIIIVNKKSSNEFEQFPRKIDKCLDR